MPQNPIKAPTLRASEGSWQFTRAYKCTDFHIAIFACNFAMWEFRKIRSTLLWGPENFWILLDRVLY